MRTRVLRFQPGLESLREVVDSVENLEMVESFPGVLDSPGKLAMGSELGLMMLEQVDLDYCCVSWSLRIHPWCV